MDLKAKENLNTSKFHQSPHGLVAPQQPASYWLMLPYTSQSIFFVDQKNILMGNIASHQ
jgi:hypothetical protein